MQAASGGRPRGITLLVAYYGLVGVGIVAVTVWALYVRRQIPVALEGFRYQPEALLGIALLAGGLHAGTAWGLWTLRPWSRLLVIGLSIVGIVVGLFTLPLGFVSSMLNIGTFWYITHDRVRLAFAKASRPKPRLG